MSEVTFLTFVSQFDASFYGFARYNTLYTSTVQPLDADQTSGSRDLATSRNETTIISPAADLQGARVPTWLTTRAKSSKKRLLKRKSTESSTTSVQ